MISIGSRTWTQLLHPYKSNVAASETIIEFTALGMFYHVLAIINLQVLYSCSASLFDFSLSFDTSPLFTNSIPTSIIERVSF